MSKTLFERLGGADGVTSLVRDAVGAHLENPTIKTRFENANDVEGAILKSIEFFSVGSGGPGEYTGKDMLSAHQGMNISGEEFIAVVDDILGVMGKHGLGDIEQKDVLAILYSLKGEIIHV